MRGHLRPRDTSRPFATAAQGSDLLQPPPGWSTKPQRSLQAPGHTAPVRTYLVNEPRLGPPTGREGSTGHSGEPQCAPEHGSVHPVNRRGPTDAPTAPPSLPSESPLRVPPPSLSAAPPRLNRRAPSSLPHRHAPAIAAGPSHGQRRAPWATQSAIGHAERHMPRQAPAPSAVRDPPWPFPNQRPPRSPSPAESC